MRTLSSESSAAVFFGSPFFTIAARSESRWSTAAPTMIPSGPAISSRRRARAAVQMLTASR